VLFASTPELLISGSDDHTLFLSASEHSALTVCHSNISHFAMIRPRSKTAKDEVPSEKPPLNLRPYIPSVPASLVSYTSLFSKYSLSCITHDDRDNRRVTPQRELCAIEDCNVSDNISSYTSSSIVSQVYRLTQFWSKS